MAQHSQAELNGLVKLLKKKTMGAVTALRTVADFLEEANNILPQLVTSLHEDAHASASGHPQKRKREIDPNAPKKPHTAYIHFSNAVRTKVKEEFPDADQKKIVTIIGERWKNLSPDLRKQYEERYMKEKEEYDEKKREYLAGKASPHHEHGSEEEVHSAVEEIAESSASGEESSEEETKAPPAKRTKGKPVSSEAKDKTKDKKKEAEEKKKEKKKKEKADSLNGGDEVSKRKKKKHLQ
ncbi:uncharacterized protein VTP21DRAFT_10119 [Calcarisporiella thermophila]|uniref:uncharacterized protein n=1 Tax=Calcarisporiella thermophila TaxID=911321 RepID=UPI003741F390